MGLSPSAVGWLIEEAQRRPFQGTVLTLGVQNVLMSQAQFEELAKNMGTALRPAPTDLKDVLIPGTVSATEVLTRLGFDQVVTTDVDEFEGCDLLFDLNADAIPDGHQGAYDMVLDAGTLEHVFHLPNAFRNLIAFTKTGGRIVHHSPSSNHIDHGFHMFSPTLFWDYYTANGLDLPRFDLLRYRTTFGEGGRWVVGTYTPGSLGKQMFGGLGGGCFAIALVAEKAEGSDGSVIPQQGMYAAAWASKAPPGLGAKSTQPNSLRIAWKKLRAKIAGLLPGELMVRWKAARRKFPLKIRRRF